MLFVLILAASLIGGPVFALDGVGGSKEEIETLNKEIASRKEKIKQLEDTIEKYKKSVEQKRLEAVSLKNQLALFDNRLAQLEVDIDLTKNQIAEAELQIEALQISIKDKEAIMERQKTFVAEMIRRIHAEDQKNYIEIMLSNASFADFYNQLKYLENVYTDLGRSIKTLRATKEELDAKKIQVEGRRLAYEGFRKKLEERKRDLSEQSTIKQNLLVQTHSSELRYRALLDSLRAQYQAIEGEVRTYEARVREQLEKNDKMARLGVGEVIFAWPVSGRYITSIFHDPDYPYRRVFEHSGIDIRSSQGTPVYATAAGYIARAKTCTLASCYSYILIIHTDNLSSVYGHLSRITVATDQFVNRGDLIGYSGGTPGTSGAGPFVTGPHLHFEARLNGIPVDPMNYLTQ